ncbi:aldo/keto reductase [Myxococcota bacterium]|nr:aldo/keto reductase [Myxococcota bacterium]MCZ7617812.1 aldo/keto reductase [Myxococcota bacterium]
MRRPRNAFLLGLALSLGIGFYLAGAVLYRTFIGLEAAAFPAGEWLEKIGSALIPEVGFSTAGLMLAALLLLGSAGLTFWLVRRSLRAATDPMRRNFLTGAASGASAAVLTTVAGAAMAFARAFLGLGNEGRGWRGPATQIFGGAVEKTARQWPDAWRGARITAYRRLGRTGFEVSDISLGTGAIQGETGEALVREAIERGVNYLDTAPDYSGSGSEQAIGRALRGKDRSKLFLATKFCSPSGHVAAGSPVARYKAVIESSLARLGTDYVDLAHVHSCDEIERLMDPNLHEAFDRLKEEGKVRFLGFSTHTPNLVQVADRAIRSGRFDVMMPAYHHGIWPSLGEVIARARREQDMGVVAMKTLKGARHHGLVGFREHADAYSQAAFRWVLSNPDVNCLVVSFIEPQHLDEYLFASGGRLAPADHAVLRHYDQQIAGSYCPPHCGACLDRCPEGLAIHDVLRYRMYFEDYRLEKRGLQFYARLGRNASLCAGCAAPCLGSCPVGIPIPQRMLESHDLLTLG